MYGGSPANMVLLSIKLVKQFDLTIKHGNFTNEHIKHMFFTLWSLQ